jgi:hypothetical protein
VACMDGGKLQYLYLGSGSQLAIGGYSIQSDSGMVKAALAYQSPQAGFVYSADKPVTIQIPGSPPLHLAAALNAPVKIGSKQ